MNIDYKTTKGRSGIYCIWNTESHKVYVGRSNDMYRRGHEHKKALKYHDTYLYKSMRKHGLDAFQFFVLEYCDLDNIEERELFYMKRMRSLDRKYGYNIEGSDRGAQTVAEESKIKMSITTKKQWADGTLSKEKHSLYMTEKWKDEEYRDRIAQKVADAWTDDRRKSQSSVMTKALTKYVYVLEIEGKVVKTNYKGLFKLGLKSAKTSMNNKGVNFHICKGVPIKRVRV